MQQKQRVPDVFLLCFIFYVFAVEGDRAILALFYLISIAKLLKTGNHSALLLFSMGNTLSVLFSLSSPLCRYWRAFQSACRLISVFIWIQVCSRVARRSAERPKDAFGHWQCALRPPMPHQVTRLCIVGTFSQPSTFSPGDPSRFWETT